MSANASIAIEAKGIKIRPAKMQAFEFDATNCPDLFPPLAVLATYCNGISTLHGVHRLVNKESNRAIALQEELGKMGIKIEIENDGMRIYGAEEITGTDVHSHHDHRIAMACAVAALKAKGETIIESAEAVNKSYPDFFWHLKKLGADVSLPHKKFLHE
jgi:3-phosphoshikimate 1-carboxyvinyltransferase